MLAKRSLPASWWPLRTGPFPAAGPPLAAAILWLAAACCMAGAPAPSGDSPAPSGDSQEKLPKPLEVPILTSDGVRLATTYYPGTKGKDSVPIVLLHTSDGSRKDYAELALHLQRQGHAVMAPDLRGHGDSAYKLDAEGKLNEADYLRMVTADMEAIKEYLRKQNNDEKLNIEKLCLVGAEMGASVAMAWTQLDWSRPPIGITKIGQDVKAVVLISPVWNTPGLPLRPVLTNSNTRYPLTDPLLINAARKGLIRIKNATALDMREEDSFLIVAGQGDSAAYDDARRVFTMLKRFHPDPPRNDATAQQDLFYGPLETKLQGTKMLKVSGLNLDQIISEFIRRRLVEQQYPWQLRTTDPHAQG